MPALRDYRIFISHAWGYDDEYCKLIEYLDAAPNFEYVNYSLPEPNPGVGNIQEALKRQIRPVHVVLILAGMYANYRNWIQFEIDFANLLGKPVIGIKPWGSENLPQPVQKAADKIVDWDTQNIVNAVRELLKFPQLIFLMH